MANKEKLLDGVVDVVREINDVVSYPFDDIPAALGYQKQGHAQGKAVIAI